MNQVFAGVRRGDVVLAALLTAAGAFLMVENIEMTDAAVRVDSRSWLMVPVFAAATLPILWRRRSPFGVLAVTAAALAVHVLAFGWVTRCGVGLPLAVALAYAAGRLLRGLSAWAALAGSLGVQLLVLVKDSSAGWGGLSIGVPLAAVAFGVGVLLARRADRPASALAAPVAATARV